MLNNRAKKETLAMIVGTFHSFTDKQQEFYERFADELGGFPGINGFLIDASDAFIYWEGRVTNDWNGEWIDATERYTEWLLGLKFLPDAKKLRSKAFEILTDHGYIIDLRRNQ